MAAPVSGVGVVPGFLRDRLAAAQAIRASERTPEVAGFIESCQLKDEAAALLARQLPSGAAAAAEEQACRRRQVALQLVSTDMLCAGAPSDEYNGAHQWAVDQFKGLLGSNYWWQLGVQPFAGWPTRIMALGRQIAGLAGSQLSPSERLDTLLLIVAGMAPPPITQQLPLLQIQLDMVADPGARAALEPLLLEAQSSLPATPLTWDQLAGRLAEHTAHTCLLAEAQAEQMGLQPKADPVFVVTTRKCAAMLDALAAAPDQPPVAVCALRYAAAVLKPLLLGESAFFEAAAAGIACALEAGSDYFVTLLGFSLARHAASFAQASLQPPYAPSQFVAWLSRAQAAFSRCKRLLPGVWVSNMTDRRPSARAALPWLRQLAAAGDCWAQPPMQDAVHALAELAMAQMALSADPNYSTRCSTCGCSALMLKTCSKCRAKDWKEGGHRHKCAELAANRKQQQQGSAAGS